MNNFDLNSFWNSEGDAHKDVAEKTFAMLKDDFAALVDLCVHSIEKGGKILFFGNGGSAADAQHLATELTVRYSEDRKPIAAIALSTDTSALTAISNDYGFEYLFSRQIEALGRKGDIAIGITTSGHSTNVIGGLQKARDMGLKTAALTGKDGGQIPIFDPDVMLLIPSNTTARIQEMHITLGQMLCGALEQKLGLV